VVRMSRTDIYFAEQTYLADGEVGPQVEFEIDIRQ
jgi:hypothetical protein